MSKFKELIKKSDKVLGRPINGGNNTTTIPDVSTSSLDEIKTSVGERKLIQKEMRSIDSLKQIALKGSTVVSKKAIKALEGIRDKKTFERIRGKKK